MPSEVKIECPKCSWEPDGQAHWQCSCGTVWNTFDTAGRCPSCKKQWKHTCCPTDPGGCGQWSLHLDWYKNLDKWLEDELEGVKTEVHFF
ncbi:MAG: hypothetical protein ACKV1O_07075 [Saprospiraceae bacterium]